MVNTSQLGDIVRQHDTKAKTFRVFFIEIVGADRNYWWSKPFMARGEADEFQARIVDVPGVEYAEVRRAASWIKVGEELRG